MISPDRLGRRPTSSRPRLSDLEERTAVLPDLYEMRVGAGPLVEFDRHFVGESRVSIAS